MRVTTKGQVTIPLDIRELLGIRPGMDVEFLAKGGTVSIVPKRDSPGRGKRVVARLRGRASARLSTDQIMALTRGGR